MNKDIMKKMGFGKAVEAVEQKKCQLCAKDIKMEEFKDKISKVEYKISGICQKCQDNIFG